MRFSVQTLLALTSAIAIHCAAIRHQEVTFLIVCIAMPVCIMLFAITSPQKGNQLDPSRRWYLHLLAKTWIYTVGIFLVVLLFSLTHRHIPDRLERAFIGDFYRNLCWIELKLSPESPLEDLVSGVEVYDKLGYVGIIRNVSIYEKSGLYAENSTRRVASLKISTDRDRSDFDQINEHSFKLDNAGRILLTD